MKIPKSEKIKMNVVIDFNFTRFYINTLVSLEELHISKKRMCLVFVYIWNIACLRLDNILQLNALKSNESVEMHQLGALTILPSLLNAQTLGSTFSASKSLRIS